MCSSTMATNPIPANINTVDGEKIGFMLIGGILVTDESVEFAANKHEKSQFLLEYIIGWDYETDAWTYGTAEYHITATSLIHSCNFWKD